MGNHKNNGKGLLGMTTLSFSFDFFERRRGVLLCEATLHQALQWRSKCVVKLLVVCFLHTTRRQTTHETCKCYCELGLERFQKIRHLEVSNVGTHNITHD